MGSPTRVHDCCSHGRSKSLQHQAWVPSCALGCKSNHKVVGYFILVLPLLPYWAHLACQLVTVGHGVHSWVGLPLAFSHRGKHPDMVKWPAEWGLPDQLHLTSLCPITQACRIFSNGVLLPSYGEKTRTPNQTIVYIVGGGASEASLTNNSS